LKWHFFYNKELEEMKRVERASGIKAKSFEGKEIYESVENSTFDFQGFEKQLRDMEWEVRRSSEEIR
jgi:hypothetical protein